MHDPNENEIRDIQKRMFSPARLATQIIGFLLGGVLVAWCVHTASSADWTKIKDASPWTLAALVGLGLLGTIIDGLVFWAILRPWRNLKVGEVQLVNMTASFLNYAPVRLGTVFRIVFHARVDRVELIPIFGWFAAITLTSVACMASVAVAALTTGGSGLSFALLLSALLATSGVVIFFAARIPIVAKYGKGMESMFGDPRALTAGLLGRLLVLAAGCGRMAVAASILGLELGASDVIVLSVAALALSFNPLGRFGWREATVALVTAQFAAGALVGHNADAVAAQLALVESAGEAIAVVPLGILTSIWAMPRLFGLRKNAASNSAPPPDEDHLPIENNEA